MKRVKVVEVGKTEVYESLGVAMNRPDFSQLIGPMEDGAFERYETQEAYDILSR